MKLRDLPGWPLVKRLGVLAGSALPLVGAAAAIVTYVPLPATAVGEMKACVVQQFVSHGFAVTAANNTRNAGFVIGSRAPGPQLTVDFDADNAARMSLSGGVRPVPIAAQTNVLEAIQRLTDDIDGNCPRRLANLHPTGLKLG
jgi:hypothetical protein